MTGTMRKNHRFIKLFVILATIPILLLAYEYGPNPGYTGAPGDNKTGCIASGCHQGTPNSGTGSVKISLPNGVTTYTPGGPAIPITILITDAKMRSYGFQLTARSGSTNTTQAGDFTTLELNSAACTASSQTCPTQVLCADGSMKANGATCPSQFPIEDIEHTAAGWSNSISSKGSYSYTFTWTPPATAVGNVTMYIAANCGTGTASVTPTDVYMNSFGAATPLVLTPAATGPSITNVQDAASFRTPIVPGAWVAISGQGMSGTTRTWQTSDFNNGNNLPTSLSGVSVNFGTLPAAVYYISPVQINVQAPSGISGTVPVTVTNNGVTTASFNATVSQNAPSLFVYPSGSNTFPAAIHVNGTLIGDGTVAGSTKVSSGETIVLYVNGIAPSPSGVIIGSAISYSGGVTVNVGSGTGTVSFVGLVAAGEYQINVTLPTGLAPGNYPITVQTAGQSSQTGVVIPVGP